MKFIAKEKKIIHNNYFPKRRFSIRRIYYETEIPDNWNLNLLPLSTLNFNGA